MPLRRRGEKPTQRLNTKPQMSQTHDCLPPPSPGSGELSFSFSFSSPSPSPAASALESARSRFGRDAGGAVSVGDLRFDDIATGRRRALGTL